MQGPIARPIASARPFALSWRAPLTKLCFRNLCTLRCATIKLDPSNIGRKQHLAHSRVFCTWLPSCSLILKYPQHGEPTPRPLCELHARQLNSVWSDLKMELEVQRLALRIGGIGLGDSGIGFVNEGLGFGDCRTSMCLAFLN